MNAYTTGYWVIQLLRRLPAPLLAALDAWSLRIARQKAQRRRQGA